MVDCSDSPVVTVTASPPSAQHQLGSSQASGTVYTYDRVPAEASDVGLTGLSSADEPLVTNASLSSRPASADNATNVGEARQSAALSLPGYSSAPQPESRGSPNSTKSASPTIRAGLRNDAAAAELRSIKTGLSASAPPAASPVSLLSLRSPSNFLDTHSTAGVGGTGHLFNAGATSGNNFSWSPTTTMFFGPKSNGLLSARFPTFKRETFDASPLTPSLYTNSGTNDGQHSYYSGSSRFGNIIDGSGPVTNHHTDWNVQTTSWTGLPTPSSEAVLKSMAGSGINHVHSTLHVESSSWDHLGPNGLALHSASQKLLDGNATNGSATLLGGHASPALFRTGGCANGMLPPTPRTVLSGVTNSRAIPRSAGFSWLYQDMAMPSFNTSSTSNAADQFPLLGRPSAASGHNGNADHHLQHEHREQQQNGTSGGHIFNFSPPQTTLGRPPLSARAPRMRLNGIDTGANTHGNDWPSEHGPASHDGSSSSVHAQSPDGSEVGDIGAAAARYHARVNGTYATEEAKWLAVQNRDPRASASFFYCVLSTKIFCRTTCPSRRPVRENICFVNSPAEANALGYRACKRCKPDVRGGDPHEARQEILIGKVKERLLQGVLEGGKGKAVKGKGLKYIAEDLGVSHWHLHRCFKKRVNQTPEAWAKAQAKKLRGSCRDDEVVYERADSRSSVGAHSVASSSSVLTTGLRGEGSSSQHQHHRHHSLHSNEHYGSNSRSIEMIPFGH